MGKSSSDNTIEDTPEQRHLAAVAAEKWNFAQQELAPLENQYMEHVAQMDSEANKSYIRGRVTQAQSQAGGQAVQGLHQNLSAAGIDPSSGRYNAAMDGMGLELATEGGENLGRAQFEQDSQKIMGLQNIVQLGQGKSGRAQAGLSQIAQQSSQNAIRDATKAFNRRSSNLQLVGSVAGAGTRYGMQGGQGYDQGAINRQYGYGDIGDPFS